MAELFKDKKIIIAFVAALVLLVAVVVALATNLGQEKIDIAEQLSLGEKYLLEMDYEKAILAFNKVIKVDPRNVKAYLGLADAYVGTGDIDKAIATLEKGLELTGDESINAKLESLKRAEGNGNEWADWSVDDWVFNGVNVFKASPEDMVKVLGGELRYYDDFFGFGPETGWLGDDNSHGTYLHNLNQFFQINVETPGVSGIGEITIGKTTIDEVLAMFPLPDKVVTGTTLDGGRYGVAFVENETGTYIWLYNNGYPDQRYPDQLLFEAKVNSWLYDYSINFDGGKVDYIWFENLDVF